ncbi:unnamed protein product [Vitrella brassicaformis CCMP3155]|uniref:J domain-containing protein n=3 Tax=Vitrella brassicaformis TaxID=1169539 RepID=A0A0G4EH96_VITBC|nr:unnamed protein product [Vitrella brassicaformis CCMP3155]|eukprot:CEL94754.1 unnamed protein product [Vitrella brassicaformis CCMP3155]
MAGRTIPARMKGLTDLLRTFGLKPGCSERELKAAYLKAAKKCHPDTTESQGPTDDHMKFVQMKEEYERAMSIMQGREAASTSASPESGPTSEARDDAWRQRHDFTRSPFGQYYTHGGGAGEGWHSQYRPGESADRSQRRQQRQQERSSFHSSSAYHERYGHRFHDESIPPFRAIVKMATFFGGSVLAISLYRSMSRRRDMSAYDHHAYGSTASEDSGEPSEEEEAVERLGERLPSGSSAKEEQHTDTEDEQHVHHVSAGAVNNPPQPLGTTHAQFKWQAPSIHMPLGNAMGWMPISSNTPPPRQDSAGAPESADGSAEAVYSGDEWAVPSLGNTHAASDDSLAAAPPPPPPSPTPAEAAEVRKKMAQYYRNRAIKAKIKSPKTKRYDPQKHKHTKAPSTAFHDEEGHTDAAEATATDELEVRGHHEETRWIEGKGGLSGGGVREAYKDESFKTGGAFQQFIDAFSEWKRVNERLRENTMRQQQGPSKPPSEFA